MHMTKVINRALMFIHIIYIFILMFLTFHPFLTIVLFCNPYIVLHFMFVYVQSPIGNSVRIGD